MSVRIKNATIHRIDLKTRMPFKYGIATMTEVPMIFVSVAIETNGKKRQEQHQTYYLPNGSQKFQMKL